MKLFKYSIISSILILLVLSSCTSRKKILYLQNSEADSTIVYQAKEEIHKITNGDVLYVDIQSLNKKLSETLQKQNTNITSSMWNSEANVFVNGYNVQESGNIILPVIGVVNVINKTVEEARISIEKSAKQFISDAEVTVKLLNFRYTILGEVNRPGTFTNYNSNLTLFQAVGEAGDINIFGNKTSIKIIRETDKGRIIIPVDISQHDILTSDVFFIKPNDVIYIEPLRNKSFRQNLPNIALIFSSISTVILVLNFIGK